MLEFSLYNESSLYKKTPKQNKMKLSLCFGIALATLLSVSGIQAQEAFKDELKQHDRDDIHSIHKKLYTKEGRHEISLNAGGIVNHEGYGLASLQYAYHFTENFGLELANGGLAFETKGNRRLYFYQTSALFSPLYGKLSFFTLAVLNFDIYAVGGLGFVSYKSLEKNGSGVMGNIGLGERFFITEALSAKIEFRNYIYKKERTSDSKVFHNYAITAGISVLFPFTQNY